MSDSQPQRTILEKRNKTLKRLESHADAPAGPSTDGTDGSTPRLLPLPRPGPIESSPEPSPDMVPSNTDNLQDRIVVQKPSRNAFARPNDRPRFEPHAESSDNSVPPVSHPSGPNAPSKSLPLESLDHLADEPVPHTPPPAPQLSYATTPPLSPLGNATLPPYTFSRTGEGFDFELHAESPNADGVAATQSTAPSYSTNTTQHPSTPTLHAQPSIPSIRAALYPRPRPLIPANDTTPRPQAQLREHIPNDLPIREEPPAPTTIARIQRSLARVFQTRAPPTNDAAAIEMNAFPSSTSAPRLARDGEAAEQRRRVEERQGWENERVDREMVRGATEERRRQRAFRIWTPVCVVVGIMLFAVIYVAVTRGE